MNASKPSPGTKTVTLAFRAMRKLWRLAVDRPYRHMMLLTLRRSKCAFQPFNNTVANRYPRIFSFVQSKLGADSALKILSYGCSTSEEVFSLRRYFPRAVIKGVDINPGNIAVCNKRLKRRSHLLRHRQLDGGRANGRA